MGQLSRAGTISTFMIVIPGYTVTLKLKHYTYIYRLNKSIFRAIFLALSKFHTCEL